MLKTIYYVLVLLVDLYIRVLVNSDSNENEKLQYRCVCCKQQRQIVFNAN